MPISFDLQSQHDGKPAWARWTRRGGQWVELPPGGTCVRFVSIAREEVQNVPGSIAAQVDSALAPLDGTGTLRQVFIPDKSAGGASPPQLYFRTRPDKSAAWGEWQAAGEIKECL